MNMPFTICIVVKSCFVIVNEKFLVVVLFLNPQCMISSYYAKCMATNITCPSLSLWMNSFNINLETKLSYHTAVLNLQMICGSQVRENRAHLRACHVKDEQKPKARLPQL